MTEKTTNPLHWWLDGDEPAAVKAVLSLAYLREDLDNDAVHDAACQVFGQQADTVIDLATQLNWIERLDSENPSEVLADYYGHRVAALSSISVCEELRDQLRAEALVSAQLVASLHTQAVAA
ncbi:hypothetical protein [uncultured Jatrophihabitans sp.]|uniref:hypothetical protein n=1 Tax=uncultured Jatrophihabitans sp. TaxID=1610747 RepID=UPI0035C9A79D